MRQLAIPALALALAACDPYPPPADFSPVIAPRGVGVGLPGGGPALPVTPTTGVFSPDPVTGPPIIEETLTDVPGEFITPPTAAPLDPSIGAAVDEVAPLGTPSPITTLPLGTPVVPDPPLATVPGGPLPDPLFAPGVAPRFEGSSVGAESSGVFEESRAAPGVPRVLVGNPVEGDPVTPVRAVVLRPPGLSDEQDFDAVSGRETIESDAERLALLRASRREIASEPVPERPVLAGPNIVRYALAARNSVGEPVHRRSGLFAVARLRDVCARFRYPDHAQEAFLEAGGPARDRYGLDPDGDGFACDWDPAPFQRAAARLAD